MRKSILFLMAAFAALQPLAAQTFAHVDDKEWRFDFQLVQHAGTNAWNDNDFAADGFPRHRMTDLRGVLGFKPYGLPVGAFFDMGVSVMPSPDMRSFDFGRLPKPDNGAKYFVRELLSASGDEGESAHFKISVGVFGDFRVTDRLAFMPHLGVGGFTMQRRNYTAVLKEDGSNTMWEASYVWGKSAGDNHYNTGGEMFGYVVGRLNFRYEISTSAHLLVGLEYTHCYRSANFYGRFRNSFNNNIQREFALPGNKMNMLGLSLGLSFR